jgi:type I restriction enzyme S subunit
MKDSGARWPGRIPAHWDARPLKHLVSISSGGTPSKSNELFWEGSIPWVSAKDMKVEALSDTQDHITQLAVSHGGMKILPPEHVIVVVRGMILAHSFPVAKNSVPVTINQDLKAIECDDLLDSDFLFHFLVGSKDLLVSMAAESAHGTLKLESPVLRNLLVPIPPKMEQEEIARHLQGMKDAFDGLVASCESAINLLQQRRAALISAAVTGKIDVRNYTPRETPVSDELYQPA